jgi:MFS superfamily sulfate permease-like transporter
MTTLLSGYRKNRLRFDVPAGLTTAAVVIPKTTAFAGVAQPSQGEE